MGKLRQLNRWMSNLQPANKLQDLVFPLQGHFGANGLHIPDHAGANFSENDPDFSICSFWYISISKDTPGKQMDIPIEPSKIPTFRKQENL